MRKSQFNPQPKNAQAVRVAMSWLRAVDIPSEASAKPGCDIAMKAADGTTVDVAFVYGLDGELPEDCIVIDAAEMSSPKRDVALVAFHILTESAGHGRPTPVDRGAEPTKRIYGDDFFAAAARHTEFRLAPNLGNEKMKQYGSIVARQTRVFFSRNARLCSLHGYEVEDLMTYAWVWTHIFAHKFERQDLQTEKGDDNERLLTKFLKDRFTEFYGHLRRVGKNTFPEADTFSTVMMGRAEVVSEPSYDPRKDPTLAFSGAETDKPAPAPEENAEAAARKRKAFANVLKKNLERLGEADHGLMVTRLLEESRNTQRDFQTRRVARQLLRKHAVNCPDCAELDLGSFSDDGEEVEVRG